jgi:multicomponent Na+:H+ antiporter subunit B
MKNVILKDSLNKLSSGYVEKSVSDLKTANIVTAVVVTFRGLDTLGEVAVLFIATAGVGLLLKRKGEKSKKTEKRAASEILQTGASFLFPLTILFGVYIFLHGHLTPGGGFQGGVVLASAFLLLLLSNINFKFNHTILHWVESLSGAFYVLLGLLGLILLGSFLNPAFLPLGVLGKLFSAGAIPLIYSFIGLKVGSELSNVLDSMRGAEE